MYISLRTFGYGYETRQHMTSCTNFGVTAGNITVSTLNDLQSNCKPHLRRLAASTAIRRMKRELSLGGTSIVELE